MADPKVLAAIATEVAKEMHYNMPPESGFVLLVANRNNDGAVAYASSFPKDVALRLIERHKDQLKNQPAVDIGAPLIMPGRA